MENLCIVKETIIETNRQPMEQEKIFANYLCNNGLICKIYLELIKLNRKASNPIKKLERGCELTFYSR